MINPQFDQASEYSEGLARVRIADKWGFIDKTGKTVIAPQFKLSRPFSEGLAAISIEDKKWGYIDKTGNIVIIPQFENAGSFSEGLAWASYNYLAGYIDKSGNFVINPQFHEPGDFVDGMATTRVGIIDKTGTVIIDSNKAIKENGFTEENGVDNVFIGGTFHEELAVIATKKCINGSCPSKFGYIDKAAKLVISPQFDEAGDFRGGLAMVKIADRTGYINKRGEYVWKPSR